MKIILIFLLSLYTAQLSLAADKQPIAEASDLKAALTHKLIEHISWKNENSIFTFKLGVLGQDKKVQQSLINISIGRKLKQRKISIKVFDRLEDVKDVQALYLCKDQANDIHNVFTFLKNKNILLLTDQCDDHKYVMLNLAFNENLESLFQVNKANLYIEGFEISPKLLFLGGSEIDVRELYHKMRSDLVTEKSKVLEQKEILIEMTENISQMKLSITKLDSEIAKQKIAVKDKVEQLKSLGEIYKDKQNELSKKQNELNSKVIIIKSQANLIESQKSKITLGNHELLNLKKNLQVIENSIETKQNNLDLSLKKITELQNKIQDKEQQSNELSVILKEKESMIQAKEGTINNQLKKINDQNSILILIALLLILFAALAISISRAYQIKQQLNTELEMKVAERTSDLKASNTQLMKEIKEREIAEEREKIHQQKVFESSKLASLGTLIAGVGHEINNPNEVIMLNAPLLKDIWKKTLPILENLHKENPVTLLNQNFDDVKPEVSQMYEDISDCSHRIKNIVQDLKDYAKPSSNTQYRIENLNSIIQVATSLLKNPIQKSTHNFKLDLGDNDLLIPCHRQQMEQVLINLIQNACQALTDKSQAIHIYTEVKPSNDYVDIVIHDEGSGIKEEDLKQLKDPFFTTKRDLDGMGLGLAITSRIVENHDGELNYTSTYGEGTKATLTLKLASET